MILRNFGLRQGRRALAAPLVRSCLRPLSTEPAVITEVADSAEPAIPSPSRPPMLAQEADLAKALKAKHKQMAKEYEIYKKYNIQTGNLGGITEQRYDPDNFLENPPQDASLEMLMAAQAHMGHNVSLWNPSTSRYIYGERAGVHIISLEATLTHLRRAARVVEQVAYHGGLILFVGTRRGHMPLVAKAAELARGCHLFQKWTPGSITNRDMILSNMQLKIVNEHDQEVPGFEEHLQDRRPVTPDLVVCLNPLENFTLLYECGLASIPTIGVIDTDADPSWVTYSIPANDDSLRAMTVVAGILGRAGERGQKSRLKAAANGHITWENPREEARYLGKKLQEKALSDQRLQEEDEADKKAASGDASSKNGGFGETAFRSIMGQQEGADKE